MLPFPKFHQVAGRITSHLTDPLLKVVYWRICYESGSGSRGSQRGIHQKWLGLPRDSLRIPVRNGMILICNRPESVVLAYV